jgi:hypothetical protein
MKDKLENTLTNPCHDSVYPCPTNCGHEATVVGGFNEVEYIKCSCGYYGDHWEEDGIVFDVPVPNDGTNRHVDPRAYSKYIDEIKERAGRDEGT